VRKWAKEKKREENRDEEDCQTIWFRQECLLKWAGVRPFLKNPCRHVREEWAVKSCNWLHPFMTLSLGATGMHFEAELLTWREWGDSRIGKI
jgi:hypothetical protein